MQRINSNDNLFHNGDGRSVLGTIVTAEWLNAVQEELVNVFTQLGGTQLEPAKHNQIAELLKTQFALKANLKSPAFTGVPTAPTAKPKTSNTQIATTEFVTREIAALVGSAPAALDTLEELARALAGDANLKQTLLNEIGKKADATVFTALHDLFVGVPIPYPLATVPAGCLAMNGQRFDKNRYPKLGQKYPSGVLPDLRGEFIRGWDNGRGVDVGRTLLAGQSWTFVPHKHGQQTSGGSIENGTFKNITLYEASGSTESGSRKVNSIDEAGVLKYDAAGSLSYGTLMTGTTYSQNSDFFNKKTDNVGNEVRPRNIAFHYICLAA